MKRDMDFIRSLMMDIEGGKAAFQAISKETAGIIGVDPADALSSDAAARLEYHLELLQDAGFVEFQQLNSGVWRVVRMTWSGHEFLDAVRDSEVWRRVKLGAAKIGGAGFSVVSDLAKAYGKQILADRLGIELP